MTTISDLPPFTAHWDHGRLKVDQVPRENWERDVDYYKRVARAYTLQNGSVFRDRSVVADYEAGTSIKDLAERYGLSTTSIRVILRDGDCSYKVREPTPEGRNEAIVARHKAGESYAAIARDYNLSSCRIRDICRQAAFYAYLSILREERKHR